MFIFPVDTVLHLSHALILDYATVGKSRLHLCFLIKRGEGDLSPLPSEHVVLAMLSTERDVLSALALSVCGFVRVMDCLFIFPPFSQHKVEREWMLSVLEEGVTDRHCYELCDQQGLYFTLLGFCSSPLCEESTQVQPLQTHKYTLNITRGKTVNTDEIKHL